MAFWSVEGSRRVLTLSLLCLPNWRRYNLALPGTWPWGKGSFIIKKETGSSLFCPSQLSQALPPKQLNFNIWPNFKSPLLDFSWIHDRGPVRFSIDLAAASRSQSGQCPPLVNYLSVIDTSAMATITRVSRKLQASGVHCAEWKGEVSPRTRGSSPWPPGSSPTPWTCGCPCLCLCPFLCVLHAAAVPLLGVPEAGVFLAWSS